MAIRGLNASGAIVPQFRIPSLERSERPYQKVRDLMSILNGIQWKADEEPEPATGEEETTPLNDTMTQDERYAKSATDMEVYVPGPSQEQRDLERQAGNAALQMEGYKPNTDKERTDYGKTIATSRGSNYSSTGDASREPDDVENWYTLGGTTPGDGRRPTASDYTVEALDGSTLTRSEWEALSPEEQEAIRKAYWGE